jgi:hypothetical protein
LLSESRFPIAGGAAVLALIYLPFVFVPHPSVPGGYGAIARAVLQIPVLGNFAYVFGAAILRNVVHATGGHAVEVGSTVYQYPPIWTYLYWLYERGGAIYIGLLSIVSAYSAYEVVRRGNWESFLLGWSVVVPFLCLSLLTVKFPRYVVSLLPFVSVSGIYYTNRLLRRVSRLGSDRGSFARSDTALGVLLGVVVLTAGLVPPSPLVASAVTSLDNDTGYDRIAESIGEYADEAPRDIAVVTYRGSIRVGLEYYLGERDDVRFEAIQLKDAGQGNGTQCGKYRRELANGSIDLVVAHSGLTRLNRACGSFDGFVRANGEPRTSVVQSDSERLVLYRFENATTRSASTASENHRDLERSRIRRTVRSPCRVRVHGSPGRCACARSSSTTNACGDAVSRRPIRHERCDR